MKHQRRPRDREAISRTFSEQHGVVSREQLLGFGVHPRAITRRLRSGALVAVRPGIYRLATSTPTSEQDLMAACLAIGGDAVVSHRGAAWFHGLAGFRRPRVEVTGSAQRRAKGVLVHRKRVLQEADVMTIRGVRVTRVARTLIDLGDVEDANRVAKALDDALRRKLVEYESLVKLVEELGTRGRRGAAMLRRLLRQRGPADAHAESELETRFLALVRRHRLPAPIAAYYLEGIAEIDFAYELQRIAIFLDGYAYHSGRPQFERDRDQANELAGLGWTVLRFTWDQVTKESRGVAERIRAVLYAGVG